MAFGILLGLVGLAALVFWIFMLVDCAKRPDKKLKKLGGKVLWIILLILFGVLAAIAYYFIVKRKLD